MTENEKQAIAEFDSIFADPSFDVNEPVCIAWARIKFALLRLEKLEEQRHDSHRNQR